MRTDAQIASLLLAFTLPIRRYRWYIAPSGAGDEVVEDVANDFNSPIEGQDPKPVSRRRDRFSHDRHLPRTADVDLGSMFFEQLFASMKRPTAFGFESWRLACRAASRRSRSTSAFDQVCRGQLR
jgi:hypothetical protein